MGSLIRRRMAKGLPPGFGPALAGILGAAILAAAQPTLTGAFGGLFDFYPLYHGARAWISGGDAYWNDPSLPDLGLLSQLGNAYPIQAVLLLGLPFAWMPPLVAGVMWVLVVGFLWVAAISWARESWAWLLWIPMWEALRIQQVSAAVTVASIFALGAIRRSNRWVFLFAIPVMAAKPQQTLFLILAFIWWGRRWWRSMLAAWGLLLLACFLAQPDWVVLWLAKGSLRAELLEEERWLGLALIPLGLLMLYRRWSIPGLAVLSTSLAPWPFAGHYVVSIWPLGMERAQLKVSSLIFAFGFLIVLTLGGRLGYWILPAILISGLALAVSLIGAGGIGGGHPNETTRPQGG